jgi:dipeptidyl-peptidase-4
MSRIDRGGLAATTPMSPIRSPRPRPTGFRSAARALAALLAPVALASVFAPALPAQGFLPALPGYERYQAMAPQIRAAVVSGALEVEWAPDGRTFTWERAGARYRHDVASGRTTELGRVAEGDAATRRGRSGPERGRQLEEAFSPDSAWRAFYRDRNLWIARADGGDERPVTDDGSLEQRIKYGTASWVYGEELGQVTAMWWSPDGSRLAYYRFDESPVRDYYLQLDQTELQSTMDVEAYPKAGTPNPVVDVFVYDLARGTSTRVNVRDGAPFTDDAMGHYVYGVGWTPDGRALTLFRSNRRQNAMELAACDPTTGGCRTVVREEWPTGWIENSPAMRWLSDGQRFVWASESTGFRNLVLYDLSGARLATLTDHPFEVDEIVRLDERAGRLWYTARSGDNPMKLQLHRVGLDGAGDVRLTDPALHHTVQVAPDGGHVLDVAQAHDRPAVTRLLDADGRVVRELAISDLTRYEELGLEPVELFDFTAADGVTTLHGLLHKPSGFDPSRRYPLLVSVYAGPATNGARETFATPHPLTEYGFLVATIDSRSAAGRGKRFLDAIYLKLGTVEVDDQAAGVRALRERPYVDGGRVGIFGTSYGGYVSVLALLRHPDVFQAASASSPVTDWRHYDTIYTERYMWTPQENAAGYDAGSALTWVDGLRGRLLLYYGTADNNVHPSNMMQLIAALQEAGKSFEIQVGPDRGHSAVDTGRMMEFFIERLVVEDPEAITAAGATR